MASSLNEANYTAACLLIVSELVRVKSDLRFQLYSLEQIASQKRGGAVQNNADSDSDEERFIDVDKV